CFSFPCTVGRVWLPQCRRARSARRPWRLFMTEPPIRSDGTLDESLLERTAGVRARFHRAWQEAARGGPEPDLDSYLLPFTEPARSWVRQELEKIADEGRRLRAAAGEHRHDDSVDAVKRA